MEVSKGITNQAIRDRFCLCFNDLGLTLDEIAERIGTHKPYLSSLSGNESPKVPALLIAKLCHEFGISPYYIILGQGAKKAKAPKTKEDKLLDANAQLLTIIGDLLNEMLVFKPVWTDKTKEIVKEAKRNVQ